NLAAWQVVEADHLAHRGGTTRFVSAQNEWSLLHRGDERQLVPACLRYGVGILPYFPLASGLLTGKYRRGEPPPPGTRLVSRPERLTDRAFDAIEAVEKFTADRGVTVLDVAVGWLAAQPSVASVVVGAARPDQVRANVEASAWQRSGEDVGALGRIVPTREAA